MSTPLTPAPLSSEQKSRQALSDFITLSALWGSSFLFMHIAAVELGALPTAGLRVGFAALFLVPILLWRGQWPALRRHYKPILFVGLLNSAIPFALLSWAVLSITTGLASILNATVPLFGALVAWLWLKDRPNASRTLGLAIGFVGVALLAWRNGNGLSAFKPGGSGWAVLACLGATLCYGIAASFTKRYMGGLPSLVSATGSQLGAALALLPLAWWFWPDHAVSLNAWLAVVALGVLCTGVAYILYFRLIERAGPARALSVTFAIPVFALLYGVILLGEVVTSWMLLCGVVIVAGTSLSTGLVRFSRK